MDKPKFDKKTAAYCPRGEAELVVYEEGEDQRIAVIQKGKGAAATLTVLLATTGRDNNFAAHTIVPRSKEVTIRRDSWLIRLPDQVALTIRTEAAPPEACNFLGREALTSAIHPFIAEVPQYIRTR